MTDMMYRLILKARFEDEAELERVLSGLERLQVQGANVQVSMGGMGREGTLGLDSLARSGLRVGFMFNMLESAYMRQTMAMIVLDNAQERYNNTVEKYGANSKEAAKAARQLELRVGYLNMANMRANVSMGLMITQLALQSGLLSSVNLAKIQTIVLSKAQTVANWLETASWKAKAAAIALATGGLSLAVGLPAYALITAATAVPAVATTVNVSSEFNIGADVDELHRALEEQERKAIYELRRSSGG